MTARAWRADCSGLRSSIWAMSLSSCFGSIGTQLAQAARFLLLQGIGSAVADVATTGYGGSPVSSQNSVAAQAVDVRFLADRRRIVTLLRRHELQSCPARCADR